ncbi:hypothetical protein RFI_15767, partial [Reticulomyxa filosa]
MKEYLWSDGIHVSSGLLPHVISRVALMALFQSLYGQCHEVISIGAFLACECNESGSPSFNCSVLNHEEKQVMETGSKKRDFVRIYIFGDFQSLAQQTEWSHFINEALQYTDDVAFFFFFCDHWNREGCKHNELWFIRPIPRIPRFVVADDGSELCQSAIHHYLSVYLFIFVIDKIKFKKKKKNLCISVKWNQSQMKKVTPAILHQWTAKKSNAMPSEPRQMDLRT